MKKNDCLYCKGQLEEKLVTRVQQFQGHWYLIENLPAFVCQQCGETFYSPETHDRVLDIIQSAEQPDREETLRVYNAEKASQISLFCM